MRDWRDILAWAALVLVAVATVAAFLLVARLAPCDYL